MLGKAAFQAYETGAVKLEDVVGRKRSKQWGTMRHTRVLYTADYVTVVSGYQVSGVEAITLPLKLRWL